MSEPLQGDGSVIYEVNLEADEAIGGPFDTWLRDHIADLLQIPGFLSAEVLADASPVPGRVRRTVQYRLRDQAALDDYLRDHAPRMRSQGVALFGDRFSAQRRVLAHREEFIRGAVSTANCLNCGEVLTGQHCSHCGQRAKVRVLSLWGMLRELFGDLTNFDSRLWRTLLPLAFRPGLLTQEYLRGRRVNYTPPFRMYLILSVAFFVLAALGNDPGAGLRFNVDETGEANLQLTPGGSTDAGAGTDAPQGQGAAPPGDAARAAKPPAPVPKLDPETQRLVELVANRVPARDRERVRRELQTELAAVPPDELAPVKQVLKDPCGEQSLKVDIGPLGEKYEPRLRDACRRIMTDTPSFGRALYENIPKMMFIFLPLIGFVMHVLYLGSGRYYVEHLLFVVHYHAFFFLGGLAILLLERSAEATSGGPLGQGFTFAEGLVTFAFVVYVPVYLYRAMRRVYAQGHFLTLAKYSVLGIAYIFFMAITAVGLLFYTALTL